MTKWIKIKGQEKWGHAECLENYNSTIQCGLDHGDCHDPACCFSVNFDEDKMIEAHKQRNK